MASTHSSTEERALKLLGEGLPPETVANTLGVSPSRISQLLSEPEFAQQVEELRFQNLQQHNERDKKYDALEDKLLSALDRSIPLLVRPMEITRALQTINAAKRRGASAPEQITHQHTIVPLVIPAQVVQIFTTNINNQVVTAGAQNLVTMPSGALLKRLEESKAAALPSDVGAKNVQSSVSELEKLLEAL